jgi:hypothetical protein
MVMRMTSQLRRQECHRRSACGHEPFPVPAAVSRPACFLPCLHHLTVASSRGNGNAELRRSCSIERSCCWSCVSRAVTSGIVFVESSRRAAPGSAGRRSGKATNGSAGEKAREIASGTHDPRRPNGPSAGRMGSMPGADASSVAERYLPDMCPAETASPFSTRRGCCPEVAQIEAGEIAAQDAYRVEFEPRNRMRNPETLLRPLPGERIGCNSVANRGI